MTKSVVIDNNMEDTINQDLKDEGYTCSKCGYDKVKNNGITVYCAKCGEVLWYE